MIEVKTYRPFLQQFWKDYAKYGDRTLDLQSPQGKEAVIAELIKLSEIGRYRSHSPWIAKRRSDFDKLKVVRKSLQLRKTCFACGNQAQCRHHIILLKNGGYNHKRNIVHLCNDCHAEIHPWLRQQAEDLFQEELALQLRDIV